MVSLKTRRAHDLTPWLVAMALLAIVWGQAQNGQPAPGRQTAEGSAAPTVALPALHEIVDASTMVTIYGGSDINSDVDSNGRYFRALYGQTETASHHALTLKTIPAWLWANGAQAWFTTTTSGGRVVVSTLEQSNDPGQPTGNLKTFGVLDPADDSFNRIVVPTIGSTTPQNCMTQYSGTSCTDDVGNTAGAALTDISDVCTVNRGGPAERTIGISERAQWNTTTGWGFPAVSSVVDSRLTGAGSVTLDHTLQKKTTDLVATSAFASNPFSVDYSPNLGECDVLPGGQLVATQYFAFGSGSRSGSVTVFSPEMVPLATFHLPNYKNSSNDLLELEPKSITAGRTDASGVEHFFVNFDNYAADVNGNHATTVNGVITQLVQEFTFNPATASVAPASIPVMSDDLSTSFGALTSATDPTSDGSLFIMRGGTGGNYSGLAGKSLAVFKPSGATTVFGAGNTPDPLCSAPYVALRECPIGTATAAVTLNLTAASPSFDHTAAPGNAQFIRSYRVAGKTRVVLVDYYGRVRPFEWDGSAATHYCDVDSGSRAMSIAGNPLAPRKGTIAGNRLYFPLSQAGSGTFTQRNQYVEAIALDQLFAPAAVVDSNGACGAPSAPSAATATAATASAAVAWTAPSTPGTSPVTAYKVTANPGGATCSTTGALSCVVTGLTPGTSYTFNVAASNQAGDGPTSAGSNTVMPYTTPGAPQNPQAAAGVTSAAVTWAAPASNGFFPVTYKVVGANMGATVWCTTTTLSCTATGLTPGVAYAFKVVAINAAGDGPASPATTSVIPTGVPGVPMGPSAVAGVRSASVSWTASTTPVYPAVSGYVVTASSGGTTCSTTGALSCTVPGLTPGASYSFTVVAINTVGNSATSAASNTVTPTAAPGAPSGVSATAGTGSATVTWTASTAPAFPAVSGYVVTASPGGATCSTTGALSCTVPGLTPGASYSFTVVATNTAGSSAASAVSNTVVPYTTPSAPQNLQATAGSASAVVTWAAPMSNGFSTVTYKVVGANMTSTVWCTTTTQTCIVTGLTPGVLYAFKVIATNAAGDGPASAATNTVIPT